MLKEKLESNMKDFVKLTLQISGILFLFGLVCVVGVYFLGIPILELLYGINLKKYLLSLIIIIVGATIYAISVVFSTSLTTMRFTFNQFIIFLITSIISTVLAYFLILHSKILGASLSYMISMIILLGLYIIEFFIKVNRYNRGRRK